MYKIEVGSSLKWMATLTMCISLSAFIKVYRAHRAEAVKNDWCFFKKRVYTQF
jgi:hypothetical protein